MLAEIEMKLGILTTLLAKLSKAMWPSSAWYRRGSGTTTDDPSLSPSLAVYSGTRDVFPENECQILSLQKIYFINWDGYVR